MKVNIRRTDDVVIFDFQGKIIGNDGIQIQEWVAEQIATSGTSKLLFNLADVSMMDSIGLGALVDAHCSAQGKGGRIGVINVGKNVRNLLVITKLIMVLEYFDSEARAVASLSSSAGCAFEARHSPAPNALKGNPPGEPFAIRGSVPVQI